VLLRKREYFAGFAIIGLFIFISVISLTSIRMLDGNGRIINFTGILRGASQKLIKEELMGYPNEELIRYLDEILRSLLEGNDELGLVVLRDRAYRTNMGEVRQHWETLKGEIRNLRAGTAGSREILFHSSQNYFDLVNRAVFSAEAFSSGKVRYFRRILIIADILVVLFIITAVIYFLRYIAIRRIAYIDPLTQMDNRTSCDRVIRRLKDRPPREDIALFMFDMNNLKLVNDFLGHQGGDRIIVELARILKEAALGFGFVGRYGGDEFLAILQSADEARAEKFLDRIQTQVRARNLLYANEIEKLSFAVGYVIGNLQTTEITEIISEADRRMYAQKRRVRTFG
jgi:diguanylate cyclase (GGDEF)-like protein